MLTWCTVYNIISIIIITDLHVNWWLLLQLNKCWSIFMLSECCFCVSVSEKLWSQFKVNNTDLTTLSYVTHFVYLRAALHVGTVKKGWLFDKNLTYWWVSERKNMALKWLPKIFSIISLFKSLWTGLGNRGWLCCWFIWVAVDRG